MIRESPAGLWTRGVQVAKQRQRPEMTTIAAPLPQAQAQRSPRHQNVVREGGCNRWTEYMGPAGISRIYLPAKLNKKILSVLGKSKDETVRQNTGGQILGVTRCVEENQRRQCLSCFGEILESAKSTKHRLPPHRKVACQVARHSWTKWRAVSGSGLFLFLPS